MELHPVFEGDQPENVWRLFSKICTIPHRSHLHEPMCSFIVGYAREFGLETHIDEAHNVIVRKKASLGRESAPPIILQAHYDMVCMTDPGIEFDFDSRPLDLRRNGDKVYAQGTTLGADDGINVAIILDILSDREAVHPPLEAIFTADEEDGMAGAYGLEYESLQGKLWINLDASPVKIGCFGSVSLALHLKTEKETIASGSVIYTLSVDNLLGGHSGNMATSERGNAIVLLNRALYRFKEQVPFQLLGIHGGLYGGSFPTEARAEIAFCPTLISEAERMIEQVRNDYQMEYSVRDPGVRISIKPYQGDPHPALSENTADRLMKLLLILPDGVFTRDHEFPDTAETISNIGRIETREDEIFIIESLRSTLSAKKDYLRDKVVALCELLGIEWEIMGEIPQWRGSTNGAMQALLKDIYPERPLVMCKGTMECGIFEKSMRQGVQILALGSPFYMPHSPAEYLLVEETALYTKRLREFIANVDWKHLNP